ncbi:MAG: hypothetical protein Crog4KO_27710 [Crocinitomicaceae bacterium]
MKCIIFLLAFFSAFSASGQVKIGDVIGILVNEYDEPVLFVHVFIEDSLENRYQTKTDPDGRFKIQGVPVGSYTLNCRTFNDTLDVEEINVPWDGLYDCGEIIMQQNIIICEIPTPPGLMYELLPRFPTDYLEITESDFDESVLRFEMQQLIEKSSSRIQLTQKEGGMSMQGSRGEV